MKKTASIALAVLIFLAAGWTTAAASDAPARVNHTIPVLIKVNKKGVVSDVLPAYNVRPAFKRMLKDVIRRMITKPAMKDGKPVESQFVITLAVLTNKGTRDHAGTTFKYLATKSLPPGSWHWVHGTDDRLALSSQYSKYLIDYPPTDMDIVVESDTPVSAMQK